MTLRSSLLAPLTSALVTGLVAGLLMLAPAPAAGTPAAGDRPSPRVLDQLRKDPTATVFRRSSYLCYGYQSCRDAGMLNAGYAANSDKMYWRMYSGHNCTNYAAYRMVKSGLPNERPWSGGGNATYWGTSVPRLTDNVPRVGAVAWWKANTGPAGSAGHVAYVERVVSADEFVVSQDSWNGDFSWAVITRSSGNWPSGFIHFNDVPLVNRAAPVVSGIAKVGSVLTSTTGSWKPTDATVSYQWFADGQPIKKATAASLKLTKARLDQQITVRTSASKLGFPTKTATSAPTPAVQPGALKNVTPPTIGGEPKVDHTLTVDGGAWTPEPTLGYQWLADGQPIDGATTTSLVLTPELVDRVITATVTANRAGYDPVSVTTGATAPVAPGTVTVVRRPSVTGTVRPGQTLAADVGAYKPADADVAVQWFRGDQPVLNATGPTYVLTKDDLGSPMSFQVTVTRAGYETTTLTAPATAPVKAAPRLSVARERFKHRVRLTITLTATDVDEVSGNVVVRVQGGFSQVVALRHGIARVNVKDLPKGKRILKVTYQGSSTVEGVTRTGSIWMP